MPKITLTLANRVEMAADALRIIRAHAKQVAADEETALDQLALAESEVLGKAPGWEEVQLSGLIEDGKNPYYQPKDVKTAAERAAESGVTMERPGDVEEPEETPEPEPLEDPETEETPKTKKGKGK